MPCRRGNVRNVVSAVLVGMLLGWSSAAIAGPRGPIEGNPKRSYGSIDVIMYQTSW